MPQHIQFKKTIRQDVKRKLRNKMAKSLLASTLKKVETAKNKEDAQVALKKLISVIDTTASKGIIKKTTAARKKSRMHKFVAKMD